MKRLNWISSLAIILGIMFTISSCDTTTNTAITTSSQDDVAFYASLLTMSDMDEVDETTNESDLKSTTDFDRCFTVDVEPNDAGAFWPRKWTINYAAEGCTDPRGNVRKGAIHVELTDFWKNDSALRTVEYRNFYFNEEKMEGTLSIENTGLNEDSMYTFTRKFQNGVLSRGDSAQMNWDCEKNVIMTNGYDSWEFADDEYDVTGGATGVNFEGLAFTMQVTNALHYRTGCFFPVSGTIDIETEGQSTATIDYGNGECDNIATLTQDGVTTEIEL